MASSSAPNFWNPLQYHNGDPFRAAELKVKRAKQHLAELADAADQIPPNQGLSFMIGPKPELRQVHLIRMPFERLPLQLGIVLGDTIHNLRTAFDHVAVALTVPPIGTGNAKNAYFPTGKDREEFVRACKIKMKGAHPDGLRIIEELEPYDGGKHSIRALHDLDVLDKHKLLVPAIANIHIQRMDVVIGTARFVVTGADFKSGTAVIDFSGNPADLDLNRIGFDGDFKATFTVAFGKGHPLDGEPIVPTLLDMANVAQGLVEACRGLFPGYVSPEP